MQGHRIVDARVDAIVLQPLGDGLAVVGFDDIQVVDVLHVLACAQGGHRRQALEQFVVPGRRGAPGAVPVVEVTQLGGRKPACRLCSRSQYPTSS